MDEQRSVNDTHGANQARFLGFHAIRCNAFVRSVHGFKGLSFEHMEYSVLLSQHGSLGIRGVVPVRTCVC